MNNAITIASSIHEPNTFFIFRENGIEVKIKIMGDTFFRSHKLTTIELEYINSNLLKTNNNNGKKIN